MFSLFSFNSWPQQDSPIWGAWNSPCWIPWRKLLTNTKCSRRWTFARLVSCLSFHAACPLKFVPSDYWIWQGKCNIEPACRLGAWYQARLPLTCVKGIHVSSPCPAPDGYRLPSYTCSNALGAFHLAFILSPLTSTSTLSRSNTMKPGNASSKMSSTLASKTTPKFARTAKLLWSCGSWSWRQPSHCLHWTPKSLHTCLLPPSPEPASITLTQDLTRASTCLQVDVSNPAKRWSWLASHCKIVSRRCHLSASSWRESDKGVPNQSTEPRFNLYAKIVYWK